MLGARCGESHSPVLSPGSKEPRRVKYKLLYRFLILLDSLRITFGVVEARADSLRGVGSFMLMARMA